MGLAKAVPVAAFTNGDDGGLSDAAGPMGKRIEVAVHVWPIGYPPLHSAR